MASSPIYITFLVCYILILIGALNWGLYAINPSWNLVSVALPATAVGTAFRNVIYFLIATAAVVATVLSFSNTGAIFAA